MVFVKNAFAIFPTVVLGGAAVNLAGSAAQKQAILPAIAEGGLKLAFAHSERQARYDLTDVVTTAKRSGGGWVLDGSKTVVSHGEAADKIVVSARTGGERYDEDGITLFLVDAGASGVARRGYVSRDDTRAADISLSNVAVSDADVLGEVGDGLPVIRRVVEAGIAATAGRNRRRDGGDERNDSGIQRRPACSSASRSVIPGGAAPAGGHVHGAGAGPQHGDAGDDVDRQAGRAERAHDIAMAKVGVGQAGRYVSQSAVQMHGGIGMTEEYAVGHYFRRCMVIERLFGDPAYYLAKLAEGVGVDGGISRRGREIPRLLRSAVASPRATNRPIGGPIRSRRTEVILSTAIQDAVRKVNSAEGSILSRVAGACPEARMSADKS